MHKLRRAGRVDKDPTPKARALVTEVIVMEGPAWVKPSLKRWIGVIC